MSIIETNSHEGMNEGISGIILQTICERPGVSASALCQIVGKSLAPERSLSALGKHHKIEHRGSKKTVG